MRPVVDVIHLIYGRLGPLKRPPFRFALAFTWTMLVTVVLVQSSAHPYVGPPAPPGQPDLARELELTAGHVVAFAGLVALWWWAFSTSLTEARALFVAVGFALIYGVLTEIAQGALPDRQSSLFDVAVNWSVTIMIAVLISGRWRDRHRLPRV